MQIKLRISSLFLFILASTSFAAKPDTIWTPVEKTDDVLATLGGIELPSEYHLFFLDSDGLERTTDPGAARREIEIPSADGKRQWFSFTDSQVMEPDLAQHHRGIRTFAGVELDKGIEHIRFDIGPSGFHAQIQTENGLAYISPLVGNLYLVFFAKHYKPRHDFTCDDTPRIDDDLIDQPLVPSINYGTIRRTYRLAVAATGEFTAAVGGTKILALNAIVTAVNFVNGIYEREVGVRFQLVANNANIIYTNAGTDPYTPASGNSTLLTQNQTNITSVIGTANFDIGHLVHNLGNTGNSGSGVATLSSVCRSTTKARGVTTASRVGTIPMNPFFYRVLIHELGHQFSAHHSYNSSCNGNRTDATAYEPGGGSTIMSYAGGCSPYNVQTLADTYFHRISLEEIATFLTGTGATCGTVTNTGNTPPVVEAGINYSIPRSTPFILTATASDPNLNLLTYSWEQYDREIATMPPLPTSTVGPNYRSFTPVVQSSRYFPRFPDVIANASPTWEVLSSVGRTLNFSLVVRDGVGGAVSDNMVVTVANNSGPFVVTAPNGGGLLSGTTTVTWNVANTTAAPVSTALVDILLSIDNGNTFPIMLVNNTPNDGSQTILLPSLISNLARIQVRAEGNIFYDVSNSPFSIGLIAQ